MKKALKITLIILASVIGTAAVLSCTVGGIPCRSFAEKHFEMIDETAAPYPYYDVKTPGGWQTLSKYGVSLQVPAGLQQLETEGIRSGCFQSEKDDDEYWFVHFFPQNEFDETDLLSLDDEDGSKLRSKAAAWLMKDYAKRHGKSLDDWYSLYDVMYSMKLDDCNFHSLKNGIAFDLLGFIKENGASFFCGVWEWHSDESDGFIMQAGTPETMTDGNHWHWMAEIYPKSNRNISYMVSISAPDYESAAQILNSIRLTDEE